MRINSTFASVNAMHVTVEDATDSEMADLIKEMEIMKTIGRHTNLRGLLGCCTQSGQCLFSNPSQLLEHIFSELICH